jgi:hypothetical protein
MKTNYFEKPLFLNALIYGLMGGLLMIGAFILNDYLELKGYVLVLVYPLVILTAIFSYKKKYSINYVKAVLLTFIIFSIMTVISIQHLKFTRWMNGEIDFFSFSPVIFFRIVGIGIVSSLVAGLFSFKLKKT